MLTTNYLVVHMDHGLVETSSIEREGSLWRFRPGHLRAAVGMEAYAYCRLVHTDHGLVETSTIERENIFFCPLAVFGRGCTLISPNVSNVLALNGGFEKYTSRPYVV